MNKRKIMLVAVALCMVAILAVGGTLAYLTDTESATNVFTTGNVDITLDENFDPENAKLIPGIDVTKEIRVTNTGSEDAFVRVHIAIPQLLDSGSPDFQAWANTLHFNMSADSVEDGYWNWNADGAGANYPGNGGNWNFYTTTVDEVNYNVYVVTYETALATTKQTEVPAIEKVYLDVKLDHADINDILTRLNGEIKILVAAEAVQAAGFDGDAYAAFAAAASEGNLPADLIAASITAD